jgi:hypothetical protein
MERALRSVRSIHPPAQPIDQRFLRCPVGDEREIIQQLARNSAVGISKPIILQRKSRIWSVEHWQTDILLFNKIKQLCDPAVAIFILAPFNDRAEELHVRPPEFDVRAAEFNDGAKEYHAILSHPKPDNAFAELQYQHQSQKQRAFCVAKDKREPSAFGEVVITQQSAIQFAQVL